MFLDHLKKLTFLTKSFIVLTLVCSLNTAVAENVADENYPTAADRLSSISDLEQMHQKKLQKTDEEYKKKMASIQKLYSNKAAMDEAYLNKRLELREKAAALKEERMRQRAELDEAFIKKSIDLQKNEFVKTNQYVINTKERKAYFDNKKTKESEN